MFKPCFFMNFNLKPTAVFFLALIIVSCKKDDVLSNKDIPGTSPFAIRIDSIGNAKIKTVSQNGTTTNLTNINLLGKITDPIFGNATVNFVSQFTTSQTILLADSAVTYTLDSTDLEIAFSNDYYGKIDSNTQMNLTVSIPAVPLPSTSEISSKTDFTTYDNPSSILFNGNVDINLATAPVIKLPVDKNLLTSIFNKFKEGVSNPDEIIAVFNGLAIKVNSVSNTEGTMLRLLPLSARTKMSFYISKISATQTLKDTLSLFVLPASKRFHAINNIASTTITNAVSNTDSTISYLQSVGEYQSYLFFPSFNQWTDSGNIVVNKAELIIKPIVNSNDGFKPSEKLSFYLLNDDKTVNESFVAFPTYENGFYSVDFTTDLQQRFSNKKKNNGYLIRTGDFTDKYSRVVLSNSNIYIKLTYTKITL